MHDTHTTPGCLPQISATIDELAPGAILVRVFPRECRPTVLFGADFMRILINQGIRDEVSRVIREHFLHVADWRYAHDFFVPSGDLYLTPYPVQKGYVPEDDHSFGMAHSRLVATVDGGSHE